MRALATLVLTLCLVGRTAAAADKLTVLLDWFVNPDHAPLIVAQEIGAYAEEGLEVEFIPPADANIPPKLVAAGHGDIAVTQQPQFYQQVDQNLPLVRIATLIDRPLATLTALQGRGITTVADLKGRVIGYGSGDIEIAEVDAILHTAGLNKDDVTLVNVGEQLSVSLLTHRVDAVTVFRNFEIFELREKGATPVAFNYEDHGVPSYDELILVATPETVKDQRTVRFLRALKKGVAYLKAHPDESWTLFLKHHGDLDDALNRQAWSATLPTFAADPAALDRDKYERYAAFLANNKLISSVPPLASYTAELKLD